MEKTEWKNIASRVETLRAELKKWEKEYSEANNGIKASRDVIRQNSDIGTNCSLHYILHILSGKLIPTSCKVQRI